MNKRSQPRPRSGQSYIVADERDVDRMKAELSDEVSPGESVYLTSRETRDEEQAGQGIQIVDLSEEDEADDEDEGDFEDETDEEWEDEIEDEEREEELDLNEEKEESHYAYHAVSPALTSGDGGRNARRLGKHSRSRCGGSGGAGRRGDL